MAPALIERARLERVAPHQLIRLLLDRHRLAVAGALAVDPMSIDELVDRTGLDRDNVLSAVGDLRAARLVIAAGGARYGIDEEVLRAAVRSMADLEIPMDPVIGYGMTDGEREILARYFSGRTLIEIPAGRAKRQVVLERIAQEFDVGRRYPERQVNEILRQFHTDTAALRRHLVDEGLLDRSSKSGEAQYWRSGGRVLGV